MAYKQNPGRPPLLKTGNGIPSALLQTNFPLQLYSNDQVNNPFTDKAIRKVMADENKAKQAVNSYKSNSKLNERDLDIEVSAASDSIQKRKDLTREFNANPHSKFNIDMHIDNESKKAADEVRKINNSTKPKPKPKPAPQMRKTSSKVGSGALMQKKEKGFIDTALEKVKQVGNAISHANEAGKYAYDQSRKPEMGMGDFGGGGGGGVASSHSKDGLDYVSGFVKDIASGGKGKTKKKTPPTQMRKPAPTKMKKC